MKPFSIDGFAERYVASQNRYMQSYEDLEAARWQRLSGGIGRFSIFAKNLRHAANHLMLSLDMHDFQTNAMHAGLRGVGSTPLEVAEAIVMRIQIQAGEPDGR